jgi:hypothetical protein
MSQRNESITKTMTWLSTTMLLLAVFQLPVANHPTLLFIVVSASGLLIVVEAIRAGKYPWAVGFLAIAVLFNPVVSVARSGRDVLLLNALGLAAFLIAALTFKRRPALTAYR